MSNIVEYECFSKSINKILDYVNNGIYCDQVENCTFHAQAL